MDQSGFSDERIQAELVLEKKIESGTMVWTIDTLATIIHSSGFWAKRGTHDYWELLSLYLANGIVKISPARYTPIPVPLRGTPEYVDFHDYNRASERLKELRWWGQQYLQQKAGEKPDFVHPSGEKVLWSQNLEMSLTCGDTSPELIIKLLDSGSKQHAHIPYSIRCNTLFIFSPGEKFNENMYVIQEWRDAQLREAINKLDWLGELLSSTNPFRN